jgi:glutathione S-transferase
MAKMKTEQQPPQLSLLYADNSSYISTKIAITAHLCGIQLHKYDVDVNEILAFGGPRGGTLLQTNNGCISQSNAIIKYLARIFPSSKLYGDSLFEQSSTEQWLELVWSEIGEMSSVP